MKLENGFLELMMNMITIMEITKIPCSEFVLKFWKVSNKVKY